MKTEPVNTEKGGRVVKPTIKPPILSEAENIQRALEPLGYEVCGCFKKHRTDRIVIYLNHVGSFSG